MTKTEKKKNKEANLKPWQPGQSGNPNGRPPLPPEIRAIKSWNQTAFQTALNTVISSTEPQLNELLCNEDTPSLVKAIASIMMMAIEEGDHSRFESILARRFGKVVDKVEVKTEPFIVKRQDGSEIVMGSKAGKENE